MDTGKPTNGGDFIGMTDTELEQACSASEAQIAPTPYWTTEIYSLGKCLRYWTKYPKILPLFVYSDHGVALYSKLFPHELNNSAKVHFTWSSMKEKRYKHDDRKKVIQIIHPWIAYRRMTGITRKKNPKGTLAFFMHSTDKAKWNFGDLDEYIKALKSLPEKFQPVVLCLHMHDINNGMHKVLRSYGLPLVTAGHVNSPKFVDRFYNLVRNFSYTTSQAWGSNVAYCIEFGVPYFRMGCTPVLINKTDPNLPLGALPRYSDSLHEETIRKADELFNQPVDNVTIEQRSFIEGLLGLGTTRSHRSVLWLLWRELFRHWNRWLWIPIFASSIFFHKYGLMPKIRQMKLKICRVEKHVFKIFNK